MTLLPQVPNVVVEFYTFSSLQTFTEINSPPVEVLTLGVSICWRNEHGRVAQARDSHETIKARHDNILSNDAQLGTCIESR